MIEASVEVSSNIMESKNISDSSSSSTNVDDDGRDKVATTTTTTSHSSSGSTEARTSLPSLETPCSSSSAQDHPSPLAEDQISSASSTTAALIASKQRLLQKENLRRVMNPPKLERKHSSGDLHSRLKTRKILGVGETDNGDIHRSKISQVLGHNEHLYVKFPRGVWNWQAFLSALLLVQALLILFFPRQACQLKLLGIQQQEEKEGLMMASKYYAVSLLALSFILWRFMFIRDKGVARTVQLAALIHFSSLCAIDLVSAASTEISHLFDTTLLTVIGVRLGTVLICSIYLSRIGTATSGLRKSPSHKDLGECMRKDGSK
ncbi:unnamed protein product [Orchesella dallaii]|uniref:Tumor protein p53-inducible protein 11 n=1 Tax=Orchesella dallaii TaxID=48710 RepID=A0ABP1PXD4_9HEXA